MVIEIELKNYRSFSPSRTARVCIQPGFTAFVGANNSGKSSLLSLFDELHPLWSPTHVDGLVQFGNGAGGINPKHVDDPAEIFNRDNNDPIVLTVGTCPRKGYVTSACWEGSRPNCSWRSRYPDISQNFERFERSSLSQDQIGIQGGESFWNGKPLLDLFSCMQRILHLPAFRTIAKGTEGNHRTRPIGRDFVLKWKSAKHGSVLAEKERVGEIERDISEVFGFRSLDISPNGADNGLNVSVDGRPFRLEEMGQGLSQVIYSIAIAGLTKSSYIFIDEPEAHLHPKLQIDFLQRLAKYSEHGVVMATHSIGLARSIAERIYAFRRGDDGVVVSPLDALKSYATLAGEMSFSSWQETGSRAMLFVEGPHDVLVFRQWLRKLKKDHEVLVLPLGGDSMVCGGRQRELDDLKRLGMPIFAVVDSERKKKKGPAKKERVAFERDCKALGFKVLLTERRATENYLPETAIQRVMRSNKYKALTPYQSREELEFQWGKDSNWRIASEMSIQELTNTDIGKFLGTI